MPSLASHVVRISLAILMVSSPITCARTSLAEGESTPAVAVNEAPETSGETESTAPSQALADRPELARATTLDRLDIPVDRLRLKVKPLTREDLEVEIEAWFLILRSKIEAISDTEIAIKIGNQATEEEQQAQQLLEAAQDAIAEAEGELDRKTHNSGDSDKARAALELGMAQLYLAKDAVRNAIGTMREFNESPSLKSELERAISTQKLELTRQVLQQATQERSDYSTQQDEYRILADATKVLERLFLDYEILQEQLINAIPESDEFYKIENARTALEETIFEEASALLETALLKSSDDLEISSESINPLKIFDDLEADLTQIEQQLQEKTEGKVMGSQRNIVERLDRLIVDFGTAIELQRALRELHKYICPGIASEG